jgi:hypothetical protein
MNFERARMRMAPNERKERSKTHSTIATTQNDICATFSTKGVAVIGRKSVKGTINTETILKSTPTRRRRKSHLSKATRVKLACSCIAVPVEASTMIFTNNQDERKLNQGIASMVYHERKPI